MKHHKTQMAAILIRYIEAKQITQSELAKELGVSNGTLSEWLDPNKHGITSKNVARIRSVCREVLTADERKVVVKGEPVHTAIDIAIEAYVRDAMGSVMACDDFPDEMKLKICAILKAAWARRG